MKPTNHGKFPALALFASLAILFAHCPREMDRFKQTAKIKMTTFGGPDRARPGLDPDCWQHDVSPWVVPYSVTPSGGKGLYGGMDGTRTRDLLRDSQKVAASKRCAPLRGGARKCAKLRVMAMRTRTKPGLECI